MLTSLSYLHNTNKLVLGRSAGVVNANILVYLHIKINSNINDIVINLKKIDPN